MKAKYSIVVPVYNEEKSIPLFYDAITKTMDSLQEPYEVIFVNDGSKDKTVEVVKGLIEKNKKIKLLSFSRNFGQLPAIYCGFEHAEGDAVVCMDVDLQDPVEVVPKMIEKWKEGYEVVHGKRTKRKGEGFIKKITSTLYLKFIRLISGLNIPENVGEFKLFDRKVIDVFKSMPEHDMYLRSSSIWVGFKQTEVEFVREERAVGKTNYSLKKLMKIATKGIVNMSTLPLNMAGVASLTFGLGSLACFITFIVLACCKIALPLTAWLFPTITLCFAVLFGVHAMNNVYVKRIYQESQNRPKYIVAEKVNIEK